METAPTVDVDLSWVEELTKRETEALDHRHARSLTYREEAKAHLPGGVSSSWQSCFFTRCHFAPRLHRRGGPTPASPSAVSIV